MKKVVPVILFLWVGFSAFAQSLSPVDSLIRWHRCYGGTSEEYLQAFYSYAKLTKLSSGYIFPVSSKSSDQDVPANYGNRDVWVVRADDDGNIVWSKNYGGTDLDESTKIIETKDGGFLIIGDSYSYNGDINSTNHFGHADALLIKTDSAGVIQWCKKYGGSRDDAAISAFEDSTGFVVVGSSYSKDNQVSNHYGAYTSADVWLFKVDAAGALVWEKNIGGTLEDRPLNASLTADNNIFICGVSKSDDGDMASAQYEEQSFVAKVNFSGNVLWVKTYGGSGGEAAYAICANADGGAYVLQHSASHANDGDVTAHYGLQVNPDVWLTRIDAAGAIIWDKTFGGDFTDRPLDMIKTSNNKLAIIGYTSSGNGHVQNYSHSPAPATQEADNSDVWFFMTDLNGDYNWGTAINVDWDYGISLGYSVIEKDVGATGGECFYLLCNKNLRCDGAQNSKLEPFIINLCTDKKEATHTGVEELFQDKFTLYPNPATAELTITKAGNFKAGEVVAIYNTMGALIKNYTVLAATNTLVLNLGVLSGGVYYLRDEKGSTARFVVM